MSELDDAAFERAYQRMIARQNLEALTGVMYGDWSPHFTVDPSAGTIVGHFDGTGEVAGGE